MTTADQPTPDPRADEKRLAAERAVTLIESGMVVGLGGGTTAAFAVARLAELVRIGTLRAITCVPCADRVGARARALGLSVVSLADQPAVDLTIDGADEVDAAFGMIKGLGGALLREKMVAQASEREVIVVDAGKLSPRLGTRGMLPVEVFAFARRSTEEFLRDIGARPEWREVDGKPWRTDEGNLIADCHVGPIADAAALAAALDARAGVAGHGLFLGLATDVLVGDGTEVRHLRTAAPNS